MKRYLNLTKLFIKYSLIRAMVYKTDFVIWSLVSFGWTIFTLLFYQLLFLKVDSIAGWTKPELLIVQGFYFIFEAILWGVFFKNFKTIPQRINNGTLDFDLMRPINTQFMLSFRFYSFDNLTNVVLGLFTIILAMKIGDFSFSFANLAISLVVAVFSLLLIYSVYFSTMCIAFWHDRFDNLQYLFPSVRDFWHYPHTFYHGIVRFLLITLTPLALVVSLPSHSFLGRQLWSLIFYLAVASIVSLILSNKIFNFAIKKYSSASS